MKNKTIAILILTTIMCLTLCITPVRATDEETAQNQIELIANKTGLTPGEELTLTVNITNLTDGGINHISTTLDYDQIIFQTVTIEDITCQNAWLNLEYDETTGLITIDNFRFITEGEVLKIKLTVNDDIVLKTNQIKETTVSLVETSATTAENEILIQAATKTVKIAEETNQINITTDKANLQIGDIVTATISIKNFFDNDGMNQINMGINYDTEIFEPQGTEYLNDWANVPPIGNTTNTSTLYLRNENKIISGDLLKITLLVKSDITFKENGIKQTEITITADEQEITANLNIAEELNEIVVTTDKTNLQKGETVTLTIDLKNFIDEFQYNTLTQKGINILRGVIEYDKTIFEELTISNFMGMNNWKTKYDETTNIWEISNKSFKTTGDALKITLTVKDNAKIGATKVTLKTIAATNTENQYTLKDKPTNINIISEAAPTITDYYILNSKYITRIPTNTTVNTLKSHINTNEQTRVYNLSDREITGDTIVGTGMIITIGENTEYSLVITGDLNGDGKLTMQDISLMQSHMVKLKTLDEPFQKAADMNQDGKLSISDLSKICRVKVGLD